MDEKILIVEDNKALAKLIAKKIQSSLAFEVDIAYSMEEAKLFLARYKYFLTLLDINLPDAPNGEIVDYVTKKKIHAIVLSGNIDKEFRKKVLQKNIIDYVNKNGVEDINYIIHTIERLQSNKKHKVLVVDDSRLFRQQMQSMLENLFFKVVAVAHGEEAIGILKTQPDFSLVLTDYNMPVMNGLELTLEIRKTYSKNELSILVLSSNEDDEITALFLKNGANDYVKKPFSKEEFSCRINNSIEALENIQMITNYANRDYLTGLYNRRYFFESINEYIDDIKESGEKFAIGIIDIDHFKKINDTFGHDVGDIVLVQLSKLLKDEIRSTDIIARWGGEEFMILTPESSIDTASQLAEKLREKIDAFTFDKVDHMNCSFGVTQLKENENFSSIAQRVDMGLYDSKQRGRNCVTVI